MVHAGACKHHWGILRLRKPERRTSRKGAHSRWRTHEAPRPARIPRRQKRPFPPLWGTAAVPGRHLRPAGSERAAVVSASVLRPLLSRLPGIHHAVAARAGARNGGRGAGRGRGVREPHPFPTPGRGRRPPSGAGARRDARSRVPSDARRDTKGWRESTERDSPYGSARGPEQPGADYRPGAGLAGTARSGAGWGAVRRSCPSPRPPRGGLAGRGGCPGRRRRARGRRGAGSAAPFSLARANGGAGRPSAERRPGRSPGGAPGLLREFFPRSARFGAEAAHCSSLGSFGDVPPVAFFIKEKGQLPPTYDSLPLVPSSRKCGFEGRVRIRINQKNFFFLKAVCCEFPGGSVG